MNEENKINTAPETDGECPENGADTDKELNEELEQLRDTFQQTYDETAAEAENDDAPVIQELDYVEETDETEEIGEDNDDEHGENRSDNRKSKKKSCKAGKRICVIIMVLSLLCSGFLCGVLSSIIKVPDTADYLSNMLNASSAESASERVKYYKAALEYCTKANGLEEHRQKIIESIVADLCEAEGFGAAKEYFDENGTEDMKKTPQTAKFKEFIAVSDKISDIADKAFDAITPYVSKDGDPDFKKIAKELGANDLILEDISDALLSIYNGSVGAEAAKNEEDIKAASNSYISAYKTLSQMGAKCQTLLERSAFMLYKTGFAHEANAIIEGYMTKEMTESPITAEFKTMIDSIKAASAFKGDIFEIASAQAAAGKTATDDFSALVTGEGLSDEIKSSVSSMIASIISAFDAEKDTNLTKASSIYSLTLESAKALGISVKGTAWKSAEILLKMGNVQGANEIVSSEITENDVKTASEEQASLYKTITSIYDAQKKANDIFYTAYSNYYYSGTPIDKASVNAELDKLITAEAGEYDKAMVCYYKYLTEAFTDKDSDVMKKNLETYASVLKDYPLIYSYDLISMYTTEKNYTAAFEFADRILKINKADDYAGKYASLKERMNGNVEKARDIALESIELSGEVNYAAYEEALCNLILGDYDAVYERTAKLVENGLSYDLCDLVKVLEKLYPATGGKNDENIKILVTQIDSAMSQNGVSVSENAKAIIDGTKTVQDVLMSGTYNFS